MSGNTSKNAGISPANAAEVTQMTAITEAQLLIKDIAGPVSGFGQVQAMLTRVARASGLEPRRVRGIWNNEARSIKAEELDALRRVAATRRRAKAEADDRDEFRAITRRLRLLEERLAQIDPGFSRASVDEDCGPAPAVGGVDRAVDFRR